MMKKVSTFIRYTIEDFLYAIDWLGTREWVDGEVPSADTKYLLELLISFILLIPMHALPFRLWMQLPFLLVMLVLNFILSTFFVRYLFKRYEAEKAAVSAEAPELTAREKEILDLLSKGYTTTQIAEALSLSKETIRWYRKKLLEKFDVSNSPELVSCAKEMRLI